MKALRLCIALILICVLAGCGSSSKVLKPLGSEDLTENTAKTYVVGQIVTQTDEVPEHFVAAVKGYLITELKKCNLLCETENESERTIDIDITYYRMRSGFSRMMLGMLAGKDGIKSNIKIKDNKTDQIIGESNISTFNVTAIGDEQDVARMHAEAIAKFITGKKDT